VIYIKTGTYKEVVTVLSNKPYITFYGQDEKNTIITYNNYHGKTKPGGGTFGTGDSASVFIQANDFNATNITFQNTAGDVGQAVAISVTGDRDVFDACQFLGWQDTLYANSGRQYYENSYIDGRVDYVFGDATAVFQNTEFYSVAGNGGTITAQNRASASETTGYVLINDKIDGAVANSTFLGRPWGPYSRVIVMDSSLGSDIEAAGWENWSTADYHLTAYYAEYNNTGPGSNTSGRISWSHQLTAQQAQQYSVNNFLNKDGWLTTAENYLNSVIAAGFA
jgi:pectinesterase